MRVLVTGANGFIGKHVVRIFKEKGCYVIGLDRTEQSSSMADEYIYCDLYSEKTDTMLDGIQEEPPVDAIVHLASDMRKEPHTIEVIQNNCVGVQRLLLLCERKKIGTFVQLSSLPVIGHPSVTPITEAHSLMPPTVYHCTKVMQELLAGYAYYTHGIRTISYRISAPVGTGMNPNTILPVFIKKALQNEDIVLYGKGTRKQTYVHVNDIAEAIYLGICSKHAQGVYNLASHNLISNAALAELCIRQIGSSSKIVFSGQDDPADGYEWDVCLDRIKEDVGYQPKVGMEEMIAELKEYFSHDCTGRKG